jgi:CubicO group peptidase (beta-lactamase class C family)
MRASEELPQRVSTVIDQALSQHRLVGTVVLVSREGELVFSRAAGFADREASRPMQENAVFRLSSLTKPIVTAAALALIEQEQIGLQDAVTRWIPEFRPNAVNREQPPITVKHLLTHTAGLSYGFFQPPDGPYHQAGVSDGMAEPGLGIGEQLSRLASVPLSYFPGTDWGYSLAIDVLGEVLARVTHTSLPQVVERLVTAPLRMDDTGFVVRDPERLATAYVDGKPPRRMKDTDNVPFAASEIRFSPSRVFDLSSFASGGTGMVGTAGDFMTLLETLRNGGGAILKPESTRAMMSNQIGTLRINVEETPSWGFGFGGAVLMDPKLAGVQHAVGTWKWGGVYGHHWYVDPVNRLTVVALTNTALEGMIGNFVSELRSSVYGF